MNQTTHVYSTAAMRRHGGRIHRGERLLLILASVGVVLSLVLSAVM